MYDYFLKNLQYMYVDMCFTCTNKLWLEYVKLLCDMHEIHVFDRKVWFATIIVCIISRDG